MNKTERTLLIIFLVWITALITYAITWSFAPKSTIDTSFSVNSPEISQVEITVEVTRLVVVTATPQPATETPTPTLTPAVTLGPASEHVELICFPGDMEQAQLESYLTGQLELPTGAEKAKVLDNGYVFLGYVPDGGYTFCVFSCELNRGGGEGLTLALYNYGANEPFEIYSLQPSSLEEQRIYTQVSHSLIVNPTGRWAGFSQLINPDGGIFLIDKLRTSSK